MAMTINTNVVSINAQRNLGLSGNSLGTTMQRLSSGLRVNSAKDDAAGLAIAERMNAQSKGLAVAARNANDGISLAQTAEGALGKVGDMLQRMRELAVQASNATNSEDDRKALQAEVSQLTAEIDRVAKTSSFNGKNLLDGSFAGGVFQVGAGAGDNITAGGITNAKANALGTVTTGSRTAVIDTTDAANLTATGLDSEVYGMSIKVGDKDAIALGTIGKASSAAERLGQVAAAINAKTADTGVTAFLEDKGAGKYELTIQSESKESVTITGGSKALTGMAGGVVKYDGTDSVLTKESAEVAFLFGADTDASNVEARITAAFANLGATAPTAVTDAINNFKDVTTPHADAGDVDVLLTAVDGALAAVTTTASSGDLGVDATLTGANAQVKTETGIDTLSVTTQAQAWKALKTIDAAIDQVNSARADLGALQTRFEKSIENIDIMNENISAARGRIVDADFATETANLSRAQILQQAGTAMVAQANQLPQGVLSLLQ